MKKIIAIVVIMLAFGLNANAQQKATTTQKASVEKQDAVKQAAAKDVEALGKVIKYEGTQEKDFMGLFEYKHNLLKENLSAERKDILSKTIEAKIKATLTSAQYEKAAAATGLMKQLTN